MKIAVLTLFPAFFDGPLHTSILERAISRGFLAVERIQIRDFARDKHNTVDDTPYGGGAGMVLRATELAAATRHAKQLLPNAPVILLSPQGETLTQKVVEHVAQWSSMILVCGRYEGVDERYVEKYVDGTLSVGDFILTGGELAAATLIDAVTRLLPGVLGNKESAKEESFSSQTLEYPQFTRPAIFETRKVPPILVSGNHGRIAKWRRKVSLLRTQNRRPDLLKKETLSKQDRSLLSDPSFVVDDWLICKRPVSELK